MLLTHNEYRREMKSYHELKSEMEVVKRQMVDVLKTYHQLKSEMEAIQQQILDTKKKQQLQEQRWATQDAASIQSDEKVLFVDLGANLGQGYSWFKNYFSAKNIAFELFELNPNCVKKLESMDDVVSGKVTLHPVGVGVEDGFFDFYGLDEREGGEYSQGGSIVQEHNSSWYTSSKDKAIKVKVINFCSYLESKSAEFDKIIVKMDIEGAEVELLEALLEKKIANLISILYVEFHSQYQSAEHARSTKVREEKILKCLFNDTNVNVRIWH